MTKPQISFVALAALAAIFIASFALIARRQVNAVRLENESLRQQAEQVAILSQENQRLSNLLAEARQPSPGAPKDQAREVLKLRGEVGALRKTAEEAAAVAARASEAPLSGVTANPEMNKMIRDQQRLGLGMIYKKFGESAKLSADKIESLNNLLADHVMTNISHITAILKDGKSPEEMNRILSAQESETQDAVKNLLGNDVYAKYQEYNRDLASYLTAEQFKGMLPGNQETKDAQANQLHELMREETQKALTARGLSADYQTVPTLNFRNIASEDEGEKNIQLLDDIYANVASGASSFLSSDELQKFGEFRKMAINNNRLALTLNRKLMAPPAK